MARPTPIRTTGFGLLISLAMVLAFRCTLCRTLVYALGPEKAARIVSKGRTRNSQEESEMLAQYTAIVPREGSRVRASHYRVGDDVLVQSPDDKKWYPGKVKAIEGEYNGFVVEWEGSEGPCESLLRLPQMKFAPLPTSALEMGAEYVGVVRLIYDTAAFVDIGAERLGYLHQSRISRETVRKVDDYLQVGQIVIVWIINFRRDGNFGLSMIEGQTNRGKLQYASFEGVPPDTWLNATVDRIEPYGIWVRVVSPDGVEAKGVVHRQYIKDGYAEDEFAGVQVDQHVKVRILDCSIKMGWLDLAMTKQGGYIEVPADLRRFKHLIPDTWIAGKVVALASYGAFVKVSLPDGTDFDGLLHITQTEDRSSFDALEVGREIQVRVIDVDTVLGMMSLSMLLVGEPLRPCEARSGSGEGHLERRE